MVNISMNCGEESSQGRREELACAAAPLNNGYDECFQPGRPSFGTNGSSSIPTHELDRRMLIDPGLLFVGAKIGEGAHGKVYEGK